MPRISMEDQFAKAEVARIYLAATLNEAQRVEAELSRHGLDYAIEVEPCFATAVLWVSEYRGAAFYVLDRQAEHGSCILRAAGLCTGLIEERDR